MERIRTYNICPNCKYVITSEAFRAAKSNSLCPRCNIKHISEFEMTRYIDNIERLEENNATGETED